MPWEDEGGQERSQALGETTSSSANRCPQLPGRSLRDHIIVPLIATMPKRRKLYRASKVLVWGIPEFRPNPGKLPL